MSTQINHPDYLDWICGSLDDAIVASRWTWWCCWWVVGCGLWMGLGGAGWWRVGVPESGCGCVVDGRVVRYIEYCI